MKKIFLLLSLGFLMHTMAHAMPVSEIRLKVTILSADEKWVRLKYAGKKVRIPRSALKGQSSNASGKEQEIALSPQHYENMKRDYLFNLN